MNLQIAYADNVSQIENLKAMDIGLQGVRVGCDKRFMATYSYAVCGTFFSTSTNTCMLGCFT